MCTGCGCISISEKYRNELFEQGFFQNRRWKKIEHPANNLLREYLDSSISTVTLQITQSCNLRCSYCPYSGGYNNREHNNKKMGVDVAKKAIDFYYGKECLV